MHLSEGMQKLVFLFIWQPLLGRYGWHRFKKSPDCFSFLGPRAHDVVGFNGSMVTYVRHSPELRTVLWTVPIKDLRKVKSKGQFIWPFAKGQIKRYPVSIGPLATRRRIQKAETQDAKPRAVDFKGRWSDIEPMYNSGYKSDPVSERFTW